MPELYTAARLSYPQKFINGQKCLLIIDALAFSFYTIRELKLESSGPLTVLNSITNIYGDVHYLPVDVIIVIQFFSRRYKKIYNGNTVTIKTENKSIEKNIQNNPFHFGFMSMGTVFVMV
jgi:hypothetical protein